MDDADWDLPAILRKAVYRKNVKSGAVERFALRSGISRATLYKLLSAQPGGGPGPWIPVSKMTRDRLMKWLPDARTAIDFWTKGSDGGRTWDEYEALLVRRNRGPNGPLALDPRWLAADRAFRELKATQSEAAELQRLERTLGEYDLLRRAPPNGLRDFKPRGERAMLRVLEPLVDGALCDLEPGMNVLREARDHVGGRPRPRLGRVLALGVERELVLLRSWRARSLARRKEDVAIEAEVRRRAIASSVAGEAVPGGDQDRHKPRSGRRKRVRAHTLRDAFLAKKAAEKASES